MQEMAITTDDMPTISAALEEMNLTQCSTNMEKTNIEKSLGIIYSAAAMMDNDFSDKEIIEACDILRPMLKHFGIAKKTDVVLNTYLQDAAQKECIEEAMVYIDDHMTPNEKLTIMNNILDIAKVDGLADAEAELIQTIVSVWSIPDDTEPLTFADDYADDWYFFEEEEGDAPKAE